ncbi:MAG: hypothetical protein H6R18_1234 [Proteobacteria bacterium]|nr:hypothetical protein [Pseudomonadota bacterium]
MSPCDEVAPHAIADREEWIELLGANPSIEKLKACGLSGWAWRQILAGERPRIPLACFRLAEFQRRGHLADLLGKDWRDFEIHEQRLLFPGLRQPLSPLELRATWIQLQALPVLRAEKALLARDMERLESRLELAERRAAQFRSMLVLEARTGMMLCRITE